MGDAGEYQHGADVLAANTRKVKLQNVGERLGLFSQKRGSDDTWQVTKSLIIAQIDQ